MVEVVSQKESQGRSGPPIAEPGQKKRSYGKGRAEVASQ